MVNIVIHGLKNHPDKALLARGALIGAITGQKPWLAENGEMIITDAADEAWNGTGAETAYVEVRSNTLDPSLGRIITAIKPFCDEQGLRILALMLCDEYDPRYPDL